MDNSLEVFGLTIWKAVTAGRSFSLVLQRRRGLDEGGSEVTRQMCDATKK